MIDSTLSQRATTHGNFSDNAEISQALKEVVYHTSGWYNLRDTQKEAIHMIFHKIARAIAGNANFADHWHDIQGYAALCEKELLDAKPVTKGPSI